MSNIDDIFKKNLSNSGMDYKDAYWHEMEGLIDEGKKKKNFISLRNLICAFAVLLLSFILFLTTDRGGKKDTLKDMNATLTPEQSITDDKKETVGIDSLPLANLHFKGGHSETVQSAKKVIKESVNGPVDNTVIVKNAETVNKGEMSTPDFPFQTAGSVIRDNTAQPLLLNVIPGIQMAQLVIMQGQKFDTGNLFISYNPPFNIKINKTVKTDTLQTSSKWGFYVAPGYEFDRYSRAVVNEPFKVNEKTVNKAGYNLNIILRRNNLGIRSGLGLLQLSERTNYPGISKAYSFDTSFRMVNPNFSQTPSGTNMALIKKQIDTTMVTTNSFNSSYSSVDFTYLKVPLAVTYQIGSGRLTGYLNAGFNMCILVQKKGNYTLYENKQYVVRDVRQNNDLNKVFFQADIAAGINYHINNTFSIYGGYGMSRSINSMIKSYVQKPKMEYFSFGLEVKL